MAWIWVVLVVRNQVVFVCVLCFLCINNYFTYFWNTVFHLFVDPLVMNKTIIYKHWWNQSRVGGLFILSINTEWNHSYSCRGLWHIFIIVKTHFTTTIRNYCPMFIIIALQNSLECFDIFDSNLSRTLPDTNGLLWLCKFGFVQLSHLFGNIYKYLTMCLRQLGLLFKSTLSWITY